MMWSVVFLCLALCGTCGAEAKTLFVIAGQSNAVGSVFWEGLQKVISALPKTQDGTVLSETDREAARQAIADSQGIWCKSTVSTVSTADKTIDELRASKLDWRAFNDSYQHPTVQILAAHYSHAKVTLHEKQKTATVETPGRANGDGVLDSVYCGNLCSAWMNSPANTHGAKGCLDAACGSNQFLSCSQACMAKRQGASEDTCLDVCTGPRGCHFKFDTQIFPACSGCGDCSVPSTQGCQHACAHATGSSGLPQDAIPGKLVDNKDCNAEEADTIRHGPQLRRTSGTTFEPLAAGFGGEANKLTFGMELSFGAAIAEKVPETVLLKVGMGGSSLGDHWRIDGPLYLQLVQETKDALQQHQAGLGGFVWFQGFNDQFEDVWCRKLHPYYESRLYSFLSKFRADVGLDMPIVIVKPRNGGKLDVIQQAQEAVASALSKVSIVPSADLSDCFHYDSGSQIVVGERAATAMLELLDTNSPNTTMTTTNTTTLTTTTSFAVTSTQKSRNGKNRKNCKKAKNPKRCRDRKKNRKNKGRKLLTASMPAKSALPTTASKVNSTTAATIPASSWTASTQESLNRQPLFVLV